MKTIGLIGGMGWESSALYYKRMNAEVNRILGGSHSAKIIMISVDFAEIERLTFDNNWSAIGGIITKSAKQLEQAGADMIVLCTNLIHIVSNAITDHISIPFLHIADATGEAIREQKLKKILLLGTQPTMEKDFYTKTLRDTYRLDVSVPYSDDRKSIQSIIYTELLKGICTESSKNIILDIIKNAQQKGIEGVILGCTELPMLIKSNDVTIPVFDTGKIHVLKAVNRAIETQKSN